jgi:hypothetical protein
VQNRFTQGNQPDTFICHASEDKEFMALPLYQALTGVGVYAWLDESEIRLGDSIRQKIDEGLANCRSATVILSKPFFKKNWTQYEMDGIVGRKMRGEILLFPIQHGITIDEIGGHSPSLAGLSLWSSSSHSCERIAAEIARQLGVERTTAPITTAEQASQMSGTIEGARGSPNFGRFYIAPKDTPELSQNEEPRVHTFLFQADPKNLQGWTPVLDSDEELEYVLERGVLRVRISWGNGGSATYMGAEFMTAQMLNGSDPFALTIRRAEGGQIYLPSVTNTSPQSAFLGTTSRSGWMTFQTG